MATDRIQKIKNILSDVGAGFKADYEIGRDDATKMHYRTRDLQELQEEGPRFSNMMDTHMGINRLRELIDNRLPILKISPEKKQALREADMDLRNGPAHKTGQMLGSAAADLTQDTSRSVYWLLNALQATGDVIQDQTLAKVVPGLYGKHSIASEKKGRNLNRGSDGQEIIDRGMGQMIDGKLKPKRGYSFDEKTGDLKQRNYSPGMTAALSIPTGIAINNALGLLTPGGGMEGYKAAVPSDEDPTKTDNVVAEVGLKYLLGQTGGLLPYDEFKKVRPDVSKDEYGKYQAFKYDKGIDLNPLDGDLNLAGALKYTNEGIHGPEIQMLGRSLPVTTGVVPFLGALAGTAAGARIGHAHKRGAMGGLAGGMAGLAVGSAAGNIIENERRRRNSLENQMDGGNAEQYL